jgi:hypothetical protein
MKITVRKCPWTQKLFECDQKYMVHLRELRTLLSFRRDIQRAINQSDQIFEWAAQNVRTTEEFEKWFKDNWDVFALRNHAIYNRRWNPNRKLKKTVLPTLISVSCRQTTPDWEEPRNSHSCPRNGVKNWERKSDLPTTYPGWGFRLDFSYKGSFSGFVTEMFDGTIVNCDRGGGGGPQSYSTGITLWADDWPAMRDFKEKQKMWRVLST